MVETMAKGTGAPDACAERAFDAAAGRFFRRIDWGAAWTVFAVVFALYFWTLAPTVTLEDAGELAVASDYLGVPHPPGYPIWTLVTWFFQWVFHWVKYYGQPDSSFVLIAKSLREAFGASGLNGHPNPAWGVQLCSAFFGALACATLTLLVSRSGASLLRSVARFDAALGARTENLFCWVAGVSAGLLLGFSPVLWSQAVIVEVYALNAFFQVLVVLFLYRWMARPKEYGALYAMAFAFGLGVTNHQTLLFLAIALGAGVLFRNLGLFRDFLIVGLAMALLVFVNIWASRAEPPRTELMLVQGPNQPAFWVYAVLAVAIPLAGALVLPHGRPVCITFLMAELGLSFYFYLFFAGEQNPPMNWAYPRTWEGFIHAVSRGQYERINPADMFSLKFVRQVGGYLTDLRNQYTLPVLLVGLLPFTAWRISWRGRRLSAYPLALGLALLSALLVIPEAMLMRAGSAAPALGAVVLAYRGLMLAIAILAGIGVLVALVGYLEAVCRPPPGADAWTRMAGWLVAAALGLGLLYVDAMVLSHVFRGSLSFGAALALCLLVIVPPAAGWAVWLLRREPHGLDLEMSPSQQTWLLATLAGFFSLTVIFVLFLNISLDIQTVFITRVQFIQSHGLYALWLGYGLLLTLTFVELLARGRRAARYAAVALALAVPGVLLHMNAYDEAQLRIIGGAEQNGHDFGWQFGAWELEGVDAILREIGPEERAGYPNPAYPRPMERNAIFFGGTDPGRFVPTYMIYSAKVRPDVFLITQNALADNMYMNVMRDLYGDAIWIPSQFDSNRAFQQYVADVQAGRISAGADVSLKDGRVSVQGVQGVMQINGILCRMIFDHNKARHAFYVEESYVIPWMYPYLEPHGLILKLNTEPVALSPETVRNDRAFWDWYTKRLLGNPKFVRDIVARKTFSKLRSAIAGIYAFRREWAEAEYAFEQSITLYPLSPEANFRLADVYLQQGKFAEAARLMEAFGREDPNNDKIGEFLAHVRGLEQTSKRKAELEAVLATGRMEVAQAVELMDVYRKMQAWAGFERLMAGLLQDANVPVEAYLRIAQMCAESRRLDLVEVALAHAVQREPGNLGVWTDLAAVQLAMQKPDAALQTVRIAVERGGEPLRDRLRGDPRFNGIRTHPEFQRLVPAAAPMGPLQLPGSLQPFLR